MRGKGITSGRRPVRPDGTYYRETRRRSLSGGRRMRARLGWAAIALVAILVVVGIVMWLLR